jgi:GNAT superfamily N-acetyltransferase
VTFDVPRGLVPTDDLSHFDCGEPALDEWLKNQAWASHVGGSAKCLVTTSSGRVVGFYAMASGQVDRTEAGRLARGMPSFVPIQLLARLAVDRSAQGLGLGASLLQDAIVRAVAVADLTGVRALVVHAKNDQARDFYQHYGFERFADAHPLHLALGMKQARAFVEALQAS